MKEVQKIEIAPEKEIKYTAYECEYCNDLHIIKSRIGKCSICGKEICINCRESIDMFPDEILLCDYDSIILNNDKYDENTLFRFSKIVCKDCANKFDYNKYQESINSLIKDFNDKIKKLNKDILGDNNVSR